MQCMLLSRELFQNYYYYYNCYYYRNMSSLRKWGGRPKRIGIIGVTLCRRAQNTMPSYMCLWRTDTDSTITFTCLLQRYPRVSDVDRNEVLEPQNARLRIAGGTAHHDGAAVLLDGFQWWILDDPRIAVGNCVNRINTLTTLTVFVRLTRASNSMFTYCMRRSA